MINLLTEEQKSKFPEYIEKWTRIGLETRPANRKETEEGIIQAYQIAGQCTKMVLWERSKNSHALLQ